ncbi:glycosyltransferase [Vibrio vulnificus]|uniref:glycosyltransferase n=1 Tax=Vibrio vulnificus TaxID=672 RepID=UPI0019D43513|nr:glycosyltransferase [Vibrio vulnificus]MBN8133420.1 glycosyltransferase [Vibrio vulnificus]MBN8161149.1 glycosyltransferase [Vibrio vulnificus]
MRPAVNRDFPKVSVYIPTYNRSELLKRAVISVFKQSYKYIEVVVCSDNSSDDTEEVISSLKQVYGDRLTYLKNTENQGACYTRNRAIGACSGDYVTGLDDDDYFEKDRISKLVRYSIENPNAIVFTGKKVFLNGKLKSYRYNKKFIKYSELLKENTVGNQVFAPRSYFLSVNGFDNNLPAWQDYDLWLRMAKKYGRIDYLNDCSYIMDISHEHERISTNLDKINFSYNHFVRKFGYNSESYFLLSKLAYPNSDVHWIDVWKIFFKVDSKRKIKLLKVLISKVIKS